MTYPIAAAVLHIRKPETRSASVRIVDDYTVEITRPGRAIKTRTGRTTETNSFCLLDITEASEKRLRRVIESAAFETHEYSDWIEGRAFEEYEVDVVEYCYKCQPSLPESPAQPRFPAWMNNPWHYQLATG